VSAWRSPSVLAMDDDRLVAVLERSRALGFLGPGPVEDQIAHARGFLAALAGRQGVVVDLGSGGGVPGLVVAALRPDLHLVLLDAMAKRCRFLEASVATLGVDAEVVEGRAEVLGRGPLRGTADAVLARSFGPPAVTAECAAPLLRLGGVLVVSEPPEGRDRWPSVPLRTIGLEVRERLDRPAILQVLEKTGETPDVYPRRDGIPAKRPLF
jgi:16S rRNA (guanine527-N7)-methyltransferase